MYPLILLLNSIIQNDFLGRRQERRKVMKIWRHSQFVLERLFVYLRYIYIHSRYTFDRTHSIWTWDLLRTTQALLVKAVLLIHHRVGAATRVKHVTVLSPSAAGNRNATIFLYFRDINWGILRSNYNYYTHYFWIMTYILIAAVEHSTIVNMPRGKELIQTSVAS